MKNKWSTRFRVRWASFTSVSPTKTWNICSSTRLYSALSRVPWETTTRSPSNWPSTCWISSRPTLISLSFMSSYSLTRSETPLSGSLNMKLRGMWCVLKNSNRKCKIYRRHRGTLSLKKWRGYCERKKRNWLLWSKNKKKYYLSHFTYFWTWLRIFRLSAKCATAKSLDCFYQCSTAITLIYFS